MGVENLIACRPEGMETCSSTEAFNTVCVLMSPDLLAGGARRLGRRSRLWMLDGEISSDDDEVVEDVSPSSSSIYFIQDPFQVSFTGDEMVRVETILRDGVVLHHLFRSTNYRGQVKHTRLLASRITTRFFNFCFSIQNLV